MTREHRTDVGTLRAKKLMPDGRLRCDAHITRSGVLEYRLPSGKIQREWRPDEEVFSPISLETLKGAIVTDDHPRAGLVTKSTMRDLSRGIVGDSVRRDGNHIAGTLYITDQELIDKMEAGKRDISPGYTCDIVKKKGVTPQGEHYDAVQTNIVYNHSAVVDVGRAGTSRARMDAAQQVVRHNEERHMATKKDEKEKDAGVALLSAASKIATLEEEKMQETARADSAEGRVEALEAEVKRLRVPDLNADKVLELTQKLENQVKRADTAERGLASLHDRVKEGVEKRVQLERSAREVCGEVDSKGNPVRFDNLTDREIMDMACEKLHGSPTPDNKSDDYARARFDTAVEGHRAGSRALDAIREAGERVDTASRTDLHSVREKHVADMQNRWQKPLPSAMKKGA